MVLGSQGKCGFVCKTVVADIGTEKITCITLSSRAVKADTRLHTHAFSAEHFVGAELFSKVISRRHLDSNCEHKLGAEKMLTFFSSSEGSL